MAAVAISSDGGSDSNNNNNNHNNIHSHWWIWFCSLPACIFVIMMERAHEMLLNFLVLFLLMTCKSNAQCNFQTIRSFLLIRKLSISLRIQMLHQYRRHLTTIFVKVKMFRNHNYRCCSLRRIFLHFRKKCWAITIDFIIPLFWNWLLWHSRV